jgi:hypothetical protein
MTRIALLAALCVACTQQTSHVCEKSGTGQMLRDPADGACVSVNDVCNPACGPCSNGQPAVDWPVCNGACDSLDEASCLANASCHAVYQDDPTPAPVFWACWDLPPSGALIGACTGLDVQGCLEHPDCVSLYAGPVNQPQNFVESFESCRAKP